MADFITSLILMGSSIFIIFQSIQMPRYGTLLTAPGFFPLIVSVVLFFMGMILFIIAIKKREETFDLEKIKILFNKDNKRLVVVILYMVIYFFVLVPYLNFLAATCIFLIAFMLYFKEIRVKWILITSSLTTLAVYLVFFVFLQLPMP